MAYLLTLKDGTEIFGYNTDHFAPEMFWWLF